uniref:Uncharacterized protein n=1 Tax=Rhizophora mucronata TaxID=61149 RepID=A0A2P2QLA0_RHIMU
MHSSDGSEQPMRSMVEGLKATRLVQEQ